ncbi:MAG: porin [Hydrogenothermaceae bacterium]|nr:porin [Hydrogenothermaceae bacterium]
MKKVVGLVAAGLFAVSVANAGQITVANTDLVMIGGVSAAYSVQENDHSLANPGFSKDGFAVNNFVLALAKPAQDGGIGVTAAIASWQAPTVVASSEVVNGNNILNNGLIGYGKSTDLKVWKAYVTYKPMAGLSLDAGLLWSGFGEKPVTILNPHITRGVLFTANPVVMAGARGSYDAGVAKLYVGTGKVGAQLMAPVYKNIAGVDPKAYIEAGLTTNLKQVGLPVDLGLHTYNEAGGRDIYALTASTDLGMVSLSAEIDYFKADKPLQVAQGNSDSALGAALCANIKPQAGIQIPIRIEYADTKKSLLIPTIVDFNNKNSVWTFTVTPTYNPTKNTFIRGEVSYVSSDKKIFINDKGVNKDTRTTGAVELGFLF